MPPTSLLGERLHRQHLVAPALTDAAAAVRWQGAVQAQDFTGALWALAQRLSTPATEADLLAEFNAGRMVRTHVLRPTWHFVAPEDLKWLLALTGPRIHGACAGLYTQLGLTPALRSRAAKVMARALEERPFLTRSDMTEVLGRARIDSSGMHLIHLLFHAELEGVICSGPRVGKQFTYALVDARVPATSPVDRDDALARLMRRYFMSHGPATVQDASWWSGLSVGDVRHGIALGGESLTRRVVDDREYWYSADAREPAQTPPSKAKRTPVVHLLPSYDEYTVAYRDRRALLHASTEASTSTQSALLSQPVMLDGRHIGTWRRTVPARASAPVGVEVQLLEPLSASQKNALDGAIERYATYLGRAVTTTVR